MTITGSTGDNAMQSSQISGQSSNQSQKAKLVDKNIQNAQPVTLKSFMQKPTINDTSTDISVKNTRLPFASESIKSANTSIGRLQTLKKSLDSIDAQAQRATRFYDNEDKLSEIRTKVDNIISESKFEGNKVFGVDIRDSRGEVVLKAIKLDTSLLEGDKREIEVFGYEVKEAKKQIKPAIERLSIDVNTNLHAQEENATKGIKQAKNTAALKDLDKESKEEGKIARFFRNMSNYLRSSHDPKKLDSERVSKLLS